MLTDKDIEHISKLARIKISVDEISLIREKLSSVFEYIGQLNTVDTDHIEPIFQTTGLISALRDDNVEKNIGDEDAQRSILLEQAPKVKDNFIKVGSVLGRSKK